MDEETCLHETKSNFLDMPLCDDDLNFIGRFDVVVCSECGEVFSKTPTEVPPPVLIPGRDLMPE